MRTEELMTIDDMINAVGLTAILLYFLLPTIIVILSIYTYNRHKRNKEIQRKLKEDTKVKFEKGKKMLENDNEAEAIAAIGDLDTHPKEMDKFNGLALSFDEHGHVK